MNAVIAIDGPAASGKGTLARRLAKTLQCAYLDTGTLYRATAYEVLQVKGQPENEEDGLKGVDALIKKIENDNPDSPSFVLHNAKLRTDEVGSAASKVAALEAVRERLTALQRDFANAPGNAYKGAILDGRDIGTVICPDADVKLYIEADIEVRAERRTKELQSKGITTTKAAVLRDMRERDERDMQRQAAPLSRAKDAIVLDTSDLGPDEAFEKALKIIQERLSSLAASTDHCGA